MSPTVLTDEAATRPWSAFVRDSPLDSSPARR